MVVPNGSSDKENDAVLTCFQKFLEAKAEDQETFLFPMPEDEENIKVARVLKSMRDLSESFCALHGGGVVNGSSIRSRDGLTPALIHQSLKRLEPGGYWGMWVLAQNGVLLVHRDLKKNEALVYAWEAQAPNHEVMGRNESVRQICPRTASSVPWERFLCSPVTECLWELAATDTPVRAIPKSYKAGRKVNETRDVVNPMYLIEYFLPALGGNGIPAKTVRSVHKKMKDDVIYSNGELPWRRAPLWAALKSLLHVVCVTEASEVTGKNTNASLEVVYKLVVQNFLAFCLDNCSGLSESATVEGTRKIVRRLEKIEDFLKKIEDMSESVWKQHWFFQGSHNFCTMVVKRKMKVCKDKWAQKCDTPVTCKVDLCKIKPERDRFHQLKSALPVLTKLVDLNEDFYLLKNKSDTFEPTCRKLLASQEMSSALLEAHKSEIEKTFINWKKEPQDMIGQLTDVATSISKLFMDIRNDGSQYFCTNIEAAVSLVVPLIDLLGSYTKRGLEFYASDSRGCGEIVTVTLSMVLIIDMLACKHYPILKEHKLGIDPTFLQYVFVPTVASKKLLCELERYINRRNTESCYPSSIEPRRSKESLSVRFASQDALMRSTLTKIQEKCKANQEAKTVEHECQMAYHDDLQNQIRKEGSCSCYWEHYQNRKYHHKCRKCNLEKEAKEIELSFYEQLLPPDEIHQLAVVFELKQPYLLVAQRRAILFMSEEICCDKWYDVTDRYLWSEESRLFEWSDIANLPFEICELGSTRKKFSQSHYNCKDHVTSQVSFIVTHDFKTELMGSGGLAKDDFQWNIKPNLFSVELDAKSPYKNLEKFFNIFSHCENEIIALKSEASEDLSLIEFEKAGTLRPGARHQLIRLSSSLAQGDIALKRAEIVSLISSTIWQAGPPSQPNEVLLSVDRIRTMETFYVGIDSSPKFYKTQNLLRISAVFCKPH
ncbi:unnamed protein product [Pseudo-nitzschia multistriata]|uniref:DUF6606 domain-containing protein n=1 Tax=Pseudo-nitzschia multistriata TaxID=183589 RepID=A0A448Z0D6_9STRA|nr:unnamed protein product [Pseudo-nitzschia multistriata]